MAELLSPFAGDAATELARLLRREFGSLASAMKAPAWQLQAVIREYPKECELMLAARSLIETAQREKIVGTPVEPDDPLLLDYLKSRLCHGIDERLLVIFCDDRHRYIIDEEMGWGTPSSIRLDTNHLVRRARMLAANAVLLAHNHPSGHCFPANRISRRHDICSGWDILSSWRLSITWS